MIEARGAALEERSDDDDAVFFGGGGKGLACRPGDRLGQVELPVVLALAEIGAGEKLLEADHLGPRAGCLGDARKRLLDVVRLVVGAGHLDEAEGGFRFGHSRIPAGNVR